MKLMMMMMMILLILNFIIKNQETQFRAEASVNTAILALTRHWIKLYFDVYDCQNIFRSDLDDDARCNDINNVAMRTDSQVTIMLL